MHCEKVVGELQVIVPGVQEEGEEEGRGVEDEDEGEGKAMVRVVNVVADEVAVVSRARRDVEEAVLGKVRAMEVTIVLSIVVGEPPGVAVTVTVIVTVTGSNC